MRTLLVLAIAAVVSACAPSRTVEIVTKPAPVREATAATHFRIVDADEANDEVVLEPVSLEVVQAGDEETEIVRVRGEEKLILPFSRFALLVEEGGVDTIELDTGDILEATWGEDGRLTRLTPRR